MISKKDMPNAFENSQPHAETIEIGSQKREWLDPAMVEVMRVNDARDAGGSFPCG